MRDYATTTPTDNEYTITLDRLDDDDFIARVHRGLDPIYVRVSYKRQDALDRAIAYAATDHITRTTDTPFVEIIDRT